MEQNDKDLEQMESTMPQDCDASESAANSQQPAVETPAKKSSRMKERKIQYAGRITLGIALIIVGVLITAGLFMPSMDLTKLAKFAPLILVALGLEILVSSIRHGDRQVKVGFGMVILCLFLIGGSVCFSLLPEVWKVFNPEERAAVVREESQKEREIYAQIDPTSVRHLHVYAIANSYGPESNIEWNADVQLSDQFESKEQFSAAAAEILQILAKEDISDVSIFAHSEQDEYEFTTDSAYALADVTGEQLLKLVDHRMYLLDQDMSYTSRSEEVYNEMKESGLLVDAEALKQAFEEGKQLGYQTAMDEMQDGYSELG